MINYDDYLDEEKPEFLVVDTGGCEFQADILQRKDGGFDLAFNRENSEFECLELAQITRLRQQAEGECHIVIQRFSEGKLTKELRKRIVDQLLLWLESKLGAFGRLNVSWPNQKSRWL